MGAYAAVAGLALSAVGEYNKAGGVAADATTAKMSFQLQSMVDDFNAQVAEQQASDALDRGVQTKNDVRRRGENLRGTQVAKMSSRGIQVSSGSALDILSSTSLMSNKDQATVMENAQREAQGYRVKALSNNINSRIHRSAADLQDPGAAKQNSMINSSGTLLTQAGQVSEYWYQN